jgi:hypothetical protein
VVEIALPWDGLKPFSKAALPPKDGDALPLNFYRISYSASGKAELMAWSPTGAANFHLPDKFGSLSFSSAPVTSLLPYRPGAASKHAVSRYRIDGRAEAGGFRGPRFAR